ncbi:MAG TPA: hypothetical protein DDX06_16590 [Curvibacter sp.]|nr:hypothetical protein [Curvibacter sp.]
MKSIALYCKSYSTDLRRVVRLARSVREHNAEKLPFYVSVPGNELPLFREHLSDLGVELLADEDILAASHAGMAQRVARMPGYLAQQVVKSEFWRLGLSSAYLCLDSDAYFIRTIRTSDYIGHDGAPYTMLDEAHDLLEDALQHRRQRVIDAFVREADLVQRLFARAGRRYSFGPFPLVWHRNVWQSLDERYLQPRGMTLADAIEQAPIESRWYGEALLAYQAVALRPCQALFKVYHYAWQFDRDRRKGITQEQLAQLYCGVILQSAWERNMDWPREGGNWLSRTGRGLRRLLGRI